jgi:hypothetical protein
MFNLDRDPIDVAEPDKEIPTIKIKDDARERGCGVVHGSAPKTDCLAFLRG